MVVTETFAMNFIKYQQESDAMNLIMSLKGKGYEKVINELCEYFTECFPTSYNMLNEYALILYQLGNKRLSYDMYSKILDFKNLTEEVARKTIVNSHFSITSIEDDYIYYDKKKVDEIIEKKHTKIMPFLSFTITTCKRFKLFEKTINSFINCCLDLDLIDEWICVDDNSSDEDRSKMRELYPFFKFYFKTNKEKGHPQSMNIIKKMVKTPYIFHMEDDWKFFVKKNYISECFDVLSQNYKIGQCLINKNYGETFSDIHIKGGEFLETKTGLRYYVHEYVKNEEEKKKWIEKHGSGTSSNYWPHFSFRPSLLRAKILHEIGDFDENVSHFEMVYSYNYYNRGYLSAFLENIYSLHIGRLTSERNDKDKLNAYILNDECQFTDKEKKNISIIKSYVVNLDVRKDRWNNS